MKIAVDGQRGRSLCAYARACLVAELGGPAAVAPDGAWGRELAATFVTARWPDGELQGCVGSLEPRRALVDDVAHNVVAAAVLDPRASPLAQEEVAALGLELSILSPLELLDVTDEAAAHEAVTPGVHGVVLGFGGRRATFLPSMWPRLVTPPAFFAGLKTKAGLAPSFWDPSVKVWRYTVTKFVDAPALEEDVSA